LNDDAREISSDAENPRAREEARAAKRAHLTSESET
jgi:hypothetical protein